MARAGRAAGTGVLVLLLATACGGGAGTGGEEASGWADAPDAAGRDALDDLEGEPGADRDAADGVPPTDAAREDPGPGDGPGPDPAPADAADPGADDGPAVPILPYPVVDSAQAACYGATTATACPAAGQPFSGQDAQHVRFAPRLALSADGLAVRDAVTGLTWQRTPDLTGEGDITAADKLTWAQAQQRPAALNAARFGGHDDWRLPTLKELYSLIRFDGTDPSGLQGSDTSGLTPFLDTAYFDFAYGDTSAGERVIDSQYASGTLYVSQGAETLLFGVNFADGRIKGYGLKAPGGGDKTFLVMCVRGNPAYGINDFQDHGDGTVTDRATGLMWTKADSGAGMDWQDALAWVAAKNAANWLGHSDWRLPDVKELQSLVDYGRSPDTTASAALDPVFQATGITNEAGAADWPYYWSSTSHAAHGGGSAGAYVAFGRGLGYLNGAWRDVHGAGCQRSDPKAGDPADYPTGHGPQGDAIRILNFVRLVRDAEGTVVPPEDLPEAVDVPRADADARDALPPDPGPGDLPPPPRDAPGDLPPGPVSCSVQADCEAPGACPQGAAKGCACSTDPQGQKRCIPACDTDGDCPKPPDRTLVCGPAKVCVPQG